MRRLLLPFALCLAVGLGGAAQAQTIREVTYNPRAVTRVNAKLRFTTMIVLPDTEEILDFVCGDKDFWVISGAQNLAYVKPAKAGVTTNLNLITAAGHIYSFVLTEGVADADLQVYVAPNEKASTTASRPPRFVAARQVEGIQAELETARQEAVAAREAASQAMDAARASAERTKTEADEAMARFRAAYPGTLHFPYWIRNRTKSLAMTAIFHDDRFTYIRADGKELPTLYEVRDRVPNLVNFQVEDGLFIVPKILDEGYLVIGKDRVVFGRTR